MKQGKLYLVATPIGNLSDISQRALKTLQSADFIAAEDTRVTRKLLTHYEIKTKMISYHHHNRSESGDKIIERILKGENCALVTDAGTPGISDPGEDLVKLCIRQNIEVAAIPGANAAVAALALSGLCAARFTFEGFLPSQKKKREAELVALKTENRTMVFYEAPHKLAYTLSDMLAVFGERNISISRELTKLYEETLRFPLSEAVAYFKQNPPRGEFVLVVEGYKSSHASDEDKLKKALKAATLLMDSGLSLKDAVKRAALDTNCSKNELYSAMVNKQTSGK
ncbi:MAG: 16S rRNA (cytidine(1402)-2'-O)-methyltransferase [Oscillospiraceae bacterium]|nr:16S rRNA (cytidine(1402)-2'-O)-methyltransferase [Oscillospiraceae bacterium]MCL2278411.1 16S rRNA (cytidine(1402)-2'-O)-methyltransferase [Oscillospiraceae bacterium]